MLCVTAMLCDIKNINILTCQHDHEYVIQFIREKLDDINYSNDIEFKKSSSIEIFEFLNCNKKFVFEKDKFCFTVYNKLIELYNDKHMDKNIISFYIKNIFNID